VSSTPTFDPPGSVSVSSMLASIQHNITGIHAPPTREDMGTQLKFEEEDPGLDPENSEMMLSFKSERESGLYTYGFPGGARQCHCHSLL
jgi:hypothetical protein